MFATCYFHSGLTRAGTYKRETEAQSAEEAELRGKRSSIHWYTHNDLTNSMDLDYRRRRRWNSLPNSTDHSCFLPLHVTGSITVVNNKVYFGCVGTCVITHTWGGLSTNTCWITPTWQEQPLTVWVHSNTHSAQPQAMSAQHRQLCCPKSTLYVQETQKRHVRFPLRWNLRSLLWFDSPSQPVWGSSQGGTAQGFLLLCS